MKESIKKQPPDWKKIVLLIAGWLALAALGGLVAAAVFAVTEPKIAEAVTREELPAKVDIPGADIFGITKGNVAFFKEPGERVVCFVLHPCNLGKGRGRNEFQTFLPAQRRTGIRSQLFDNFVVFERF